MGLIDCLTPSLLSLIDCLTPSPLSLFSATAVLTSSFHHSLPFLLFPPIFLIPHTPFAHFKSSSLKQLHSSSTPSSSLSFTSSHTLPMLSWYSRSFPPSFLSLPFFLIIPSLLSLLPLSFSSSLPPPLRLLIP